MCTEKNSIEYPTCARSRSLPRSRGTCQCQGSGDAQPDWHCALLWRPTRPTRSSARTSAPEHDSCITRLRPCVSDNAPSQLAPSSYSTQSAHVRQAVPCLLASTTNTDASAGGPAWVLFRANLSQTVHRLQSAREHGPAAQHSRVAASGARVFFQRVAPSNIVTAGAGRGAHTESIGITKPTAVMSSATVKNSDHGTAPPLLGFHSPALTPPICALSAGQAAVSPEARAAGSCLTLVARAFIRSCSSVLIGPRALGAALMVVKLEALLGAQPGSLPA